MRKNYFQAPLLAMLSLGPIISQTATAAPVNTLASNPTITFSNNAGFSDNIAQDGEGGSLGISDIDILTYPINNKAEKLTATTLQYHNGSENGWTGYPSIITYGDLPAYYGWVIKSSTGNNFSLKNLSFLDWGNFDGATFVINAFDNGSSKGTVTFKGNTTGDFVLLSNPGNLSTLFNNVDEIRIYQQGGIDSYIALNNIQLGTAVVPASVTVTGTTTQFSACLGTASTPQNISISGTGLTSNVSISAPTNFEVSLSATLGYEPNITLPANSGTLASTVVFIRLKANATGTPSGSVAITATGVSDQNISVSGISKKASTKSIQQLACHSYFFNDRQLTQSGTYFDTLSNAAGCDSIVTLHLTVINTIPTLSKVVDTLKASPLGANYLWIDCDHDNALVQGATGATFVPANSGHYAVIIRRESCMDTSACVEVKKVITASDDAMLGRTIELYPNPTEGLFTLNLPVNALITITNALGHVVYKQKLAAGPQKINLANESNGVYALLIQADQKFNTLKFVIQ